MTTKSREGQPNPDAAIVEAALEKHPLPVLINRLIWKMANNLGMSAHKIATASEETYPAFAQALREGIAARRGQRFGGHGIQPPQGDEG